MFSQKNSILNAGLAIAALAGIWTLIHIILGLASSTANDYWNQGLLVLFVLTLVLAFVHYAQKRSTLQPIETKEQFPEPSISRFFTSSTGSSPLWFVVRMYVGAEWLLAGWEKTILTCLGNIRKSIIGICRWCVSEKHRRESSRTGMVRLIPPELRPASRWSLLSHRQLGRDGRRLRHPLRSTDRYRRRLRRTDELELPASRHSKHQSNPGHDRTIPGLLMARLRLARNR